MSTDKYRITCVYDITNMSSHTKRKLRLQLIASGHVGQALSE